MKRLVAVVAVVFALGIWGGMRAYHSDSLAMQIQTGIAIAMGCNLLLCLWIWFRARPGSGDAMVVPTMALLSASMLVGILPRLFWPAAERIHIAASIVSIFGSTVVIVMQIRRLRRLRRGAPVV